MTALVLASMTADNWIALAISLAVAAYLVCVLVFPERF